MRTLESPTASGKRKTRFEEITDLPDIVIEVFDDGAGVNEQPESGGMDDFPGRTYEHVTVIEEGNTETIEVSDDYRIESSGDTRVIDQIVDIEKMSVEIETGEFSDADTGLSSDIVPDEMADESGTGQSVTSEEEPADSGSGAIDDLPVVEFLDSDDAPGVEEVSSDTFFSESLGISTETGLKKNRINGISEPEAMSGADRHSFDALVNDVFESRVLDDEFVILQSDIEQEQSSQPPQEEAFEERKTQEHAPEEVRRREKRISEIIIDISAEDKRKFASDFHGYDFKAIDLERAEKIALEDIVFLSEEDLVEELEEIDLVPVESREEVDIRIVMDDEVFQNDIDVLIKEMEIDGLSGDERIETRVVVETDEIVPPVEIESEASLAESGNAVDENDIPQADSHDEALGSDVPALTVVQDRAVMMEVEETVAETLPEEKPVIIGEQELNIVRESHPGFGYEHVLPELEKEPVTQPVAGPHSIAEDTISDEEPAEEARALPAGDAEVIAKVEEKEILPEELKNIALRKNARIIDDRSVEKDILAGDEKIFNESDLDRITSSIVEVVEGNSIIMNEAKIEEDKENIAAILSGTAMAFEDLLTELEDELVFSDEDIGFLDKSFVSEDFLREGKRSFEARGKTEQGKMTSAVEFFGLDGDEITTIEGAVFAREFQNVDLKSIASSARAAYEQPPEDREMIRKYEYLAAHDNVMDERERESIEADISVHRALILEEDIDEIREKYAALSTKKISGSDEVYDISDKVFILDNEDDLKRFADTLPPDKRVSILKLLTYLDGLFEKLPEDVIKRFAESEYYNLYTQVLQDLDK